MSDMTYDAFISYSHKDLRWGRWVQERLERYRLPKDLQPGGGTARKSLRVFRDQTDLAGVELQASLQRELEASRCLIVICSPHSAVSPWVNEEIRYFKSLGRADSIIPFIVDGEPESSNPLIECYPNELRNEENHHFMGANIKEIGKNKALLKVISVCLGVRFDRLANREQRQRRRNLLLAAGTLLVVVSLFVGLLWRNMLIAKENERMALERERIARENEAIAKENERIAQENQALVYDNYVASMLPIVVQGYAAPEDLTRVEASADAGNPQACFYLAYMIANGLTGNEPDPDLAYPWYLRGAEMGDPACMAAVGAYLLTANGANQDPEKGFEWTLRAAEAGQASAMYSVGLCLEGGLGTEKNEAEAFSWYLKAAENDYTDAYDNLANCYMFGIGVEEDYEQFFYWVNRMAEAGSSAGMYAKGLCYHRGFGTEADPREAYLWYRRSADAGNADGMYWTAWCLENHYGVESEAEEWYARAAELGQADAAAALERIRGEREDQEP